MQTLALSLARDASRGGIPWTAILCCLPVWIFSGSSHSAHAVVWRNDLTSAEVEDLAMQGQFAGVGVVRAGGSVASGTAIAPEWILTAKHVVGSGSRASFTLNGVTYNGTSIGHPSTDVALIELDAGQQLPSTVPFVAPNPTHNVVDQLVWKVGWGRAGSIADSQAGQLSSAGVAPRAGTNIVNSRNSGTAGGTNALIFNNSNTNANSTLFEVSTAPGDSGGPLFYQHDHQWFVAGTTFGAVGGVGFVEANVSEAHAWIIQRTGALPASPAPTELFWDGDYSVAGVQQQTGGGRWHLQRPDFEANGQNYTWENDSPMVAVFGTPNTAAAVIQLESDIVVGGIRFADKAASGPFQINSNNGNTIRGFAGGATIEAETFGAIGASIVGQENFAKTGDADLLIRGDNSAFDAEWVVRDGTLIIDNGAALGTGGFTAATKTTVEDGATLRLRGPGVQSDEHMHVYGGGHDSMGAIHATVGDHVLTERIAVRSETTIRVDDGSSLTVGDANGRFYNRAGDSFGLIQEGGGIVVYDNANNIGGLTIVNGVAAGDGGVNGTFRMTLAAELRPGDSAAGTELGSFTVGDAELGADTLLTIDLDPMANQWDRLIVDGTIRIASDLGLNLWSAPTLGQTFLIVENDGTDAIIGTPGSGPIVSSAFDGTDYFFRVSTFGGSGNDLVLTSIVAVPEPGTLGLLAVTTIGLRFRSRRRRG